MAFRLTEGYIDLTIHDAQFSNVMGKVEGILGRVSKTMQGITVAAGAMMGGITSAALVAMKTYGSFERAMRRATAVSDATERQFRVMSAMAEEQSIRLNVAAINAADAFYYLGSAGLSVTEQMQAFVPVVTLAKAGVISAAEAAENMVDTIKGFRMEFSQTGHVADVMTQAVISSNMNFTQLGQTLELVAGVAHIMNNSLEDTVAVIAHMANVGIKASMAGTSLRRALLNLGAPTTAGSKMLKKWDVAVYDMNGRMKPFIEILGDLNEKLKFASEEQRNMAFRVLFGARAISGQVAVFQTGKKALVEYANSLREAGGATERVAKRQLQAFLEQLGKIWRRIKLITRHVGEMLAPGFLRLAKESSDTLDLIIEKLDGFSLSVQEWGEKTAVRINWLRRELFELAKFMVTDWPAAWGIATAAVSTQFEAMKNSIKSVFSIIVDLFIALGKTLGAIFKKLWNEFENRAVTAAQRATAKQIEYIRERVKAERKQTEERGIRYTWSAKGREEAARIAREKVALSEQQGIFDIAFPSIPTKPWEKIGAEAGKRLLRIGSKIADMGATFIADQKASLEAIMSAIPDSLKEVHRDNLERLRNELIEIEEKYAELRLKDVEKTEKETRSRLPTYRGGGLKEPTETKIGFVGLTEMWSKLAIALGENTLLGEQRKTTRGVTRLIDIAEREEKWLASMAKAQGLLDKVWGRGAYAATKPAVSKIPQPSIRSIPISTPLPEINISLLPPGDRQANFKMLADAMTEKSKGGASGGREDALFELKAANQLNKKRNDILSELPSDLAGRLTALGTLS